MDGKYGAGETDDAIDEEGKDDEVTLVSTK